jgi:small subunit ribosomal protein S20
MADAAAAKTKKTMRHASALKAGRQADTHRAQNFQVRSRVRTLTSLVLKAISEKNADAAKKNFRVAQSAWQKAAKQGVFHSNVAARKISRLAARLATLSKTK